MHTSHTRIEIARLCLAAICHVALLVTPAHAEDIRVLSSIGIQAVIEELAPRFEQSTKHRVTTVFDLASTLKTKIEGGEPFDVAILTPPLLDDLISRGVITAASRSLVARAGLGLMIKAGAAKPDVSSVEAFTRTLQSAESITYASAGASGIAFLAIVEKLGIAAEVRAKSKPAATGEEVNTNITSGAAQLAVLPISEILPVKGAELGGAFPSGVQTYVVMAAGINAKAQSSAAGEFLSFLMSPANTAAIQAKGMVR